jgi:hypothetical protein
MPTYARRQIVHYAFIYGAWPPRALNSLPGPSRHRQGEPFNFSRRAVTNKNHRRLDSVRLRPPRDSEIGRAGRLLLPTISWGFLGAG